MSCYYCTKIPGTANAVGYLFVTTKNYKYRVIYSKKYAERFVTYGEVEQTDVIPIEAYVAKLCFILCI